MRGKIFYLLFITLFACEPVEKLDEDGNVVGASSATLLQELKTLAGSSCSRTSDCFSAGIGSKSCGGPEDYVAFSKWDSAFSLMDKIYSYNKARETENAGKIGTCEYRIPPAIICSQNKCVKTTASDTEERSYNVISGLLMLSPSGLADAPSLTFKPANNSTTYYLRVSQLDLAARSNLETYRKSSTQVKLNVRIFALMTEAPACEFMFASCTSIVSVYDVRAIRVIAVQ